MGVPRLAEQRQSTLWQWHRALLGACAVAHVDAHPGTLNSRDLQVGAFLQPQATGIESAQAGALARQPHTREERVPFVHAEADRQRVCLRRPYAGQRRPGPFAGVVRDKLAAAARNGAGAA